MKFLKSLKNFVDGLVHVPRYFLNFFQSCAFLKRQISDFMMVKNFIDFLTFFQEKKERKSKWLRTIFSTSGFFLLDFLW